MGAASLVAQVTHRLAASADTLMGELMRRVATRPQRRLLRVLESRPRRRRFGFRRWRAHPCHLREAV